MTCPQIPPCREIILLAAVCHALTAQGQTIQPKPVKGPIQWVYGYEEGQKLARESGKPLFVVFRCER